MQYENNSRSSKKEKRHCAVHKISLLRAYKNIAQDRIHVLVLNVEMNTTQPCVKRIQVLQQIAEETTRLFTMRIHKVSSVCKYCRCNAAVLMVRIRAEFVCPFGSNGRNFADNRTMFTHRSVCLKCSRKSRSPPHVKLHFLHYIPWIQS
jgi:hypothetical protein